MIIYSNTKEGFFRHIRDGYIADIIEEEFKKHDLSHNNEAEHRAWANSLMHMRDALDDNEISNDCQIAIEFQIPLTSKRVDFLVAGEDEFGKSNIVVIELKQRETAEVTTRADVVYTFTGGANRYVTHPSYQAYSYAKIISEFNEEVANIPINLIPCAFLHNFKEEYRNVLEDNIYKDAISYAPIFLSHDKPNLRNFIKKFIKKRSNIDLLMKIENGKLKPSKSLQDTLVSLIEGNKEFYLIDEQKVAYETVKTCLMNSFKNIDNKENKEKITVIVKGGPGTGKSVIAIQLLVDLMAKNYSVAYVTKNATPRNVYFNKLISNNYKKRYVENLFLSSGSFVNAKRNQFDCLLCDEAHRLNAKSGLFQNKGENQIKEIIHASRVSVFFIDEEQKVTSKDIGTIDEIKKYAEEEGSEVIYRDDLNLVSQFRCNGSNGYLAFLDNLLGIRPTANKTFDIDYDLQIFDDLNEMRDALKKKNDTNKARMLAGYCYEWVSKNLSENDDSVFDITIGDFKAKWNFNGTKTWAIDPNSFDQVGCIHTCQGLEFDYVGVIIGKDLRYENGRVITDKWKRAKTDQSLKGFKNDPKRAKDCDEIIRNTYKVLLTRGQKGCYIYCEDKAFSEYIKKVLNYC